MKLSITAADANLKAKDGSDTTPEAELFKKYAAAYGLKPEWLGKTFVGVGRRAVKVLGLRDTRARNNVLLDVDGKTKVCSPDYIILLGQRQA